MSDLQGSRLPRTEEAIRSEDDDSEDEGNDPFADCGIALDESSNGVERHLPSQACARPPSSPSFLSLFCVPENVKRRRRKPKSRTDVK